MRSRNQIFLALTMILVAIGAVVIYGAARGEQETAADPMAGHDHSAMASADEAQPVTLSPDASRRIGVTYAVVESGTLSRTVRTVGFVTYDETRLASVNPKIEGWVEHLYVDFTGAPVREGDALLDVYSPALVTAQEELLLARDLLAEAQEHGSDRTVLNAEDLLAAARRRLAYWDIPEEEIHRIEEQGQVTKTLTLRAPASGIVLKKNVVDGARIMPGMNLFEIADLDRIWVEAEVFEKDLSLISQGQPGVVTFDAYPGESFGGSVTYVYPTVSSAGRTGRVRLELPNPGLRIKPGMYAQVELQGPPLGPTLLVPRSAVLQTGERSVVFHRMAGGELHPVEVVTGLSADDKIQILSGLEEGQTVVSSATFLIDAESNLGAAMAGMAGMAGMDHSGMDMGGREEMQMDSSSGQMEGMATDTTMGAMDHSQHQMRDMPADTISPANPALPSSPGGSESPEGTVGS